MVVKMKRLFGTDGIRGRANSFPMTIDMAQKLGTAAGHYFRRGNHRHCTLIGKDTRLSGYMIESALVSGFTASGVDVMLVGPLPTPAIAFLTRSLRADLGVMISASHNSYEDNGIKLFAPDGFKLSQQNEHEIEALMQSDMQDCLAQPQAIGRAKRIDDAAGRYIENVKSSFPRGLRLDGVRIVIDCANGSAYHVAPSVLWELGAEVIRLGCEPDGTNINDHCGSTHPDVICKAVVKHRADLGIALDGDADRVLISDETGHLIDGDQILAIIAHFWKRRGRLQGNALVSTVMSNMGLEDYLSKQNIELIRTPVGDRQVVHKMRNIGANIGGEQSGHMVLTDFSTTGDGLITAMQILAVVVESGKTASQVCRPFKPFPQKLRNVRYSGSNPLERKEVKEKQDELVQEMENQGGRLMVRPSGTEPLIRVMAEARDVHLVDDMIRRMCDVVEQACRHG